MSRALRDVAICREALARLPELELSELRQHWGALYKSDPSRMRSFPTRAFMSSIIRARSGVMAVLMENSCRG